jgi:molecular chaperone DnaK
MAADNMSLGRFRLEGIAPAPRGLPQVEVTFDIDANGILNVAARDKATGKEQRVTITASTNLNKGEIDRMVQEARQNETADRQRRELIDARNQADSLAYQTEKALRDLGDKVPAAESSRIQERINALRQVMNGEDMNAIKRGTEELQNAFHALSQQLYAQQGGAPQDGAPRGGEQPGSPFAGYSGGNGNGNGRRPDDEGEVVEGEFHQA